MKTQRPFLEKLRHGQQQLEPPLLIRRVAEGSSPSKPLARYFWGEKVLSTSYHEPLPCVTTGPDHSSSVPFSRASCHRNTEVYRGDGFTWIRHCGQVRLGAVSNHWVRLRKEKKTYGKSLKSRTTAPRGHPPTPQETAGCDSFLQTQNRNANI